MEQRIMELVNEIFKNSNSEDLYGIPIKYRENIILNKDCRFNSLMIVELIASIEDNFNIEIDFTEMNIDEIYNLDLLIKHVNKKLSIDNFNTPEDNVDICYK